MELTVTERSVLLDRFKKWKTNPILQEDRIRTTNSNVLLIDGNNTYLRAWFSINSMNINGDHTGGIVGFFRSIGYAIKLLHPTRCIL